MADIAIDTQGSPTTPSPNVVIVYADSGTKQVTAKNETGRVLTIPGIKNWNTADVIANAADTYLTGSSLAIPQHLMQAGTTFKWRIFMSKTAAGAAAPLWNVRVGPGSGGVGVLSDTSRLLFTGTQTAAADTGFVEIFAILRNTGASGVLAGGLTLNHNLNNTGFSSSAGAGATLQVTSAGFDTTVANLFVGVSVNPGASGVWTHQVILAEAFNV